MRFIRLTDREENTSSVLFFNGGGQIIFSRNHAIVKYFSTFNVNIISVELPGHGKSSFDHIIGEDEFINDFLKTFKDKISNEKILIHGLVGFSLGGLLILKLLESKICNPNFSVIYGAGLALGEKEVKTFDYYITEDFFRKMQWINIMKKNHGDGWVFLLGSLQKSLHPKNKIFVNPKNIRNFQSNLLIILGEEEELFSPKVTNALITTNDHIQLITIPNTSHFEYFTKSKKTFLNLLTNFDTENKWFNSS